MKKYTLTILDKDYSASPQQIEGNDLVELMGKLLILIAQLGQRELTDDTEFDDIDIPF